MTELQQNKKIYFVSDCHFGVPNRTESLKREKRFIEWLDFVRDDMQELYIMGDLFEFWFEYKTVVQKGHVRLLGKLAEISDAGIPVYFFRGNHDVWAFDYLEEELNFKIYPDTLIKQYGDKTFFLGHGDGLGEGDNGYKFLKKVFRNKINQWLFRWLHPDIGTGMGLYWSNKSRVANENAGIDSVNDVGINRLAGFSKEMLKKYPEIDYFIFGHIHRPQQVDIEGKAIYFSVGDWIKYYSYLVFDGKTLEHHYFKPQ
ncbi:MAG: UDP-2,3-diacylglucosamine diphosphatase [Bacteroidales bacterium]|nr:UDP-2,3-diacylglucosamine diphosphatase [Bacteroidales bacterium]